MTEKKRKANQAWIKAYRQTPEGREATRLAKARYSRSEKGKEAQFRANKRKKQKMLLKVQQNLERSRSIYVDPGASEQQTKKPFSVSPLKEPTLMECIVLDMLNGPGQRLDPRVKAKLDAAIAHAEQLFALEKPEDSVRRTYPSSESST